MNDFVDRVVVVTGSSRGIGLKTAALFLQRGARVVINGRDEERILRAQRLIDPDRKKTLAIVGDVGCEDDSKRLIQTAIDAWGRIDVLVCNAGTTLRGQFVDLSPGVLHTVVDTNIHGSMMPVLYAIPFLTLVKGSVIIISSLAGIRGLPGVSVYSASKMALTGFADSLRMELHPAGVHVGILYVGFTENDPEKRILAADGTLIPIDRPSQLTQEDVAKKIMRQVIKRRKAIVMTPVGKSLWILQRFAPWMVTFILRMISSKIAEMSK